MPAARKLDLSKLPKDSVPYRIAAYVNLVFKGNLSAASAAIVCDYDVLYRAVQPTAKSPSLDLLKKLAAHSQRTVDQWLE